MPQSVRFSLLNELAEAFRALRKDLLDPYRPERHYMRGPGPKSWAKRRTVPVHVTTGPLPAHGG